MPLREFQLATQNRIFWNNNRRRSTVPVRCCFNSDHGVGAVWQTRKGADSTSDFVPRSGGNALSAANRTGAIASPIPTRIVVPRPYRTIRGAQSFSPQPPEMKRAAVWQKRLPNLLDPESGERVVGGSSFVDGSRR